METKKIDERLIKEKANLIDSFELVEESEEIKKLFAIFKSGYKKCIAIANMPIGGGASHKLLQYAMELIKEYDAGNKIEYKFKPYYERIFNGQEGTGKSTATLYMAKLLYPEYYVEQTPEWNSESVREFQKYLRTSRSRNLHKTMVVPNMCDIDIERNILKSRLGLIFDINKNNAFEEMLRRNRHTRTNNLGKDALKDFSKEFLVDNVFKAREQRDKAKSEVKRLKEELNQVQKDMHQSYKKTQRSINKVLENGN